ncbi:MAG TPA: hypothetical protein VLC08_06035 [Chitinolyticbacter sp.]|nr:hypothetical protein [Chitinolyticbacter sp.]
MNHDFAPFTAPHLAPGTCAWLQHRLNRIRELAPPPASARLYDEAEELFDLDDER